MSLVIRCMWCLDARSLNKLFHLRCVLVRCVVGSRIFDEFRFISEYLEGAG